MAVEFVPRIQPNVMCTLGMAPHRKAATPGYGILYLNARSLVHKWNLCEMLTSTLPIIPEIIVVTETWLLPGEGQFYNLENYTSFHSTRDDVNRGGGVAIFIRGDSNGPFLIESIYTAGANFLVIKLATLNLHIIAIYRPNTVDIIPFCNEIDRLLGLYPNSYVVGDFNLTIRNEDDC